LRRKKMIETHILKNTVTRAGKRKPMRSHRVVPDGGAAG
jgi:hypothetical protein